MIGGKRKEVICCNINLEFSKKVHVTPSTPCSVFEKKTHDSNGDTEFVSPPSSPLIKRPRYSHDNSDIQTSNERTTVVALERINESTISIQSMANNETSIEPLSSKIRIESADTAVKEIDNDKSVAQQMIVTYGMDPVEILHMVERWTQTLLGEFHSSYYRFKHILKDKWEKQELHVNSDLYNRERLLYDHVKNLEQSKENYFSKTYFDELKVFLTKLDPNTNVNQLKSKIKDVIEIFLKIVESMEFVEQYHENRNNINFETIKNVLQKLQVLNNKKCHSICIIGLEKCGKSTFINALLGFELLPARTERCTQIRTVLKPTLEEQPLLLAVVDFYNDDEFRVLFDKMVKKSDEEEQQYQARKSEVQQKHQQFMRTCPQRKEMLTTNTNSERKEIIKKLHGYITDELCVNIIKEISIYTDKLPGKNYELLDVPGFDSPIKEHRDAGLQAIKSADAFLFLTDGGRPSLTRDQIRLLNEIQDGRQYYEAMKRAFAIITKLDLCHTTNKFNEHYTKARHELISKGFRENHIFAVCSITNLRDKNSQECTTIVNKIQDFNNLQNGFQQSKEALNQFIELELPKTHLNQLIDLASTKLSHYVNASISNAKKILPSTVNFTDQESFDDYIKQENDQKWDKIYNDKLFQPTFDDANRWQKTVLVQERDKFLEATRTKFCDCFTARTKDFIEHPVDIHSQIMKQYDYTVLQSTSQPIDDQLRKQLSFDLQEAVVQTVNTLARHLHDEYINQLEQILNKISLEGHDDLYRTQLLSYDICRYEIRAAVLRTCRPIIIATLRFSHSDQQCRYDAIMELKRIAPTIGQQLCENNNEKNRNISQTISIGTR